jgi:hypothetical protein
VRAREPAPPRVSADPVPTRRRAARLRFLRHVYERSHADVAVFLDGTELADELGLDSP